jgi:hypothetical protein
MLLAVAGTSFNKTIALIDYQLNKNYIASSLCVNRSKPMSCCKGKCFLRKQMQKDEETGKNGVPVSGDKFDVSLFCEAIAKNGFDNAINDKIFSDYYQVKKYSTDPSPFFHPPGKA